MPDLIGHLPHQKGDSHLKVAMRTMNKVPSAVRPVGAGNDKQGECCDKTLEFWHNRAAKSSHEVE